MATVVPDTLKDWAEEIKKSEALQKIVESWAAELIRSPDPEPENWWMNFFGLRWRRPEAFLYKFWYLVKFYPPEGFNLYLRSLLQNSDIKDIFPSRDYKDLFHPDYASWTVYNNEFSNLSRDTSGKLIERIIEENFNTLSSLVRVVEVPQHSFKTEDAHTLSASGIKYIHSIKHNQIEDIKISFVNPADVDPPLILTITPNDLFRLWLDYASGLPSSEESFTKVKKLADSQDRTVDEIISIFGDQMGKSLLPLDLLWGFRIFVLRPFKLKTDYRSLWEKLTAQREGSFGIGDLGRNIAKVGTDILKETAENLLGGVGFFSNVKKLKDRPLDLLHNVYDIVGIPAGTSGVEFDYSESDMVKSEIDVKVVYYRTLSRFKFSSKT